MATAGEQEAAGRPPPAWAAQADSFRENSYTLKLEQLRQQARGSVNKLTGTLGSLALMLQVLGAGAVGVALLTALFFKSDLDSMGVVLTFVLAIPGVLVGGGGVYFSRQVQRTFPTVVEEASQALAGGLGLLLVADELPALIEGETSPAQLGLPAVRSEQIKWADHLQWFACRFSSIKSRYVDRASPRWIETCIEIVTMRSLSWLKGEPIFYCAGGCLAALLFAPVGIPLLILTCWLGLWHLAAHSRLVAITEYLLGQAEDGSPLS